MRVIRTKDSKENLCDTCQRRIEIPLCMPDDVEFGDGYGKDNVVACSNCLSKYSETVYSGEISRYNNALNSEFKEAKDEL